MPITLPSGLVELLGQIQNGIRTGFQRSHTYGTAFAGRLPWLRDIGLDKDADFNLKPRPETQRGSATLGVAAHNGNHVALIDELKYDSADPDSRKFMNVIEKKQRIELGDAFDRGASAAEIEAIKVKYRVELMNAADFWSTLELYQENLDKLGFSDLRSVAFNRADPRTMGRRESAGACSAVSATLRHRSSPACIRSSRRSCMPASRVAHMPSSYRPS